MRPVCLRMMLLPAMFGPVIIMICCSSVSSSMSFGMNGSPIGMNRSTTGCRPALITRRVDSFTSGFT